VTTEDRISFPEGGQEPSSSPQPTNKMRDVGFQSFGMSSWVGKGVAGRN